MQKQWKYFTYSIHTKLPYSHRWTKVFFISMQIFHIKTFTLPPTVIFQKNKYINKYCCGLKSKSNLNTN